MLIGSPRFEGEGVYDTLASQRFAVRRAAYRLVLTGLVFWALAGTVYAVLRITYANRPAYIHVKWAETVDDAARRQLEAQYGLALPEPKDGRTIAYALTDRSTGNIRRLVLDPAVEDTHQIDRTTFRALDPARLPYVTSHPAMPAALELLTIVCLSGGFASLTLGLIGAAAPTQVHRHLLVIRNAFLESVGPSRPSDVGLTSWIAARIPAASAEAVALFRVAFGSALLMFFFSRPVLATWAVNPSNTPLPAHRALLRIFVDAPWLVDWLRPWLAFWGALFMLGAFARPAFACLTVGAFAWAVLYTTQTTHHTVSALLMTLLVLQGSRWSDAWSIDAWRRRARPRPRGTPRQYGFTVWAPSFVLGLIYFAAAAAKLRESGLAWILNGTVKYHFLSDSPQAMVDWGLRIGRHHWLAVLLSFGAIAIETLVIVGVCARAYRYRVVAGCAALSLVLGFTLLQGLFWPGWWILLLSFLPWHLVPTPGASPSPAVTHSMSPALGSRGVPRLAVFMVIALVTQQLVISVLKLEVPPLLSTYDMYSTTYASPAEYERKAGQTYWLVGLDDSGGVHRCGISQGDAETIARSAALGDKHLRQQFPSRCFESGMHLQSAFVEVGRVHVDWAQWRIVEEFARSRMTASIALDPAPERDEP
jgi:hypothetical protein